METMTARQYFAKLKIGDLFFKNFLNAVRSGNNRVSHSILTEALIADDKWVTEIENLFFSTEQIVKDPKKSIIDEKVIVPVEKAKKTTAESIRHLSSHSNFVRSIDENGDVHPNKILTTFMEEDLIIYENRFVYTLITRLQTFLEQKYEYLKENTGIFDTTRFNLQSEFKYGTLSVEYDLNVKIKKPEGKADNKNEQLLLRIENLRRRVKILTGSEFYHQLSKTRPLSPPIAKTNIIRMNTDYNNCYKLWLFLSSFVNTGYSVSVSDKELNFEQEYLDDLTYLVALSLKAVMAGGAFEDADSENYTEQESREYNIVRGLNYKPTFDDMPDDYGEVDYLNQYYYEKIKEILTVNEEGQKEMLEQKRDFAFPFTNFYRHLSRVNNMVFEELIGYRPHLSETRATRIEKKQEDLKFAKELYRRNNLLLNLKKIDARETEMKNIRLLEKVKKLQYEIDMLKEKLKEQSDEQTTDEIAADTADIKNAAAKETDNKNDISAKTDNTAPLKTPTLQEKSYKVKKQKGFSRGEVISAIEENDVKISEEILGKNS